MQNISLSPPHLLFLLCASAYLSAFIYHKITNRNKPDHAWIKIEITEEESDMRWAGIEEEQIMGFIYLTNPTG